MDTLLRKMRVLNGESLDIVAEAVGTDKGNLSKIERGIRAPSRRLAEKLVEYYGPPLTEMHLLYPERYARKSA